MAETFTTATNPAVNTSVKNARAAVWTDWRARRDKATISDDEDIDLDDGSAHNSNHENSDDEEVDGLIMPEDDEDSDNEYDSQSVDDQIEAEWEREWAEMGALYFLSWSFPPNNLS
jgi:hypothetical protein